MECTNNVKPHFIKQTNKLSICPHFISHGNKSRKAASLSQISLLFLFPLFPIKQPKISKTGIM